MAVSLEQVRGGRVSGGAFGGFPFSLGPIPNHLCSSYVRLIFCLKKNFRFRAPDDKNTEACTSSYGLFKVTIFLHVLRLRRSLVTPQRITLLIGARSSALQRAQAHFQIIESCFPYKDHKEGWVNRCRLQTPEPFNRPPLPTSLLPKPPSLRRGGDGEG